MPMSLGRLPSGSSGSRRVERVHGDWRWYQPARARMSSRRPAAGRSTRLNIVEQSLNDSLERLRELPASPRVRELRARVEGYQRTHRAWSQRPPTEEQRAALVKLV